VKKLGSAIQRVAMKFDEDSTLSKGLAMIGSQLEHLSKDSETKKIEIGTGTQSEITDKSTKNEPQQVLDIIYEGSSNEALLPEYDITYVDSVDTGANSSVAGTEIENASTVNFSSSIIIPPMVDLSQNSSHQMSQDMYQTTWPMEQLPNDIDKQFDASSEAIYDIRPYQGTDFENSNPFHQPLLSYRALQSQIGTSQNNGEFYQGLTYEIPAVPFHEHMNYEQFSIEPAQDNTENVSVVDRYHQEQYDSGGQYYEGSGYHQLHNINIENTSFQNDFYIEPITEFTSIPDAGNELEDCHEDGSIENTSQNEVQVDVNHAGVDTEVVQYIYPGDNSQEYLNEVAIEHYDSYTNFGEEWTGYEAHEYELNTSATQEEINSEWQEVYDPQTNQVYYYNNISGEARWQHPTSTEQ